MIFPRSTPPSTCTCTFHLSTRFEEARELALAVAPARKVDDAVLREICWFGAGSLSYVVNTLKTVAKGIRVCTVNKMSSSLWGLNGVVLCCVQVVAPLWALPLERLYCPRRLPSQVRIP